MFGVKNGLLRYAFIDDFCYLVVFGKTVTVFFLGFINIVVGSC